jgi:hypothetical protein
MKLRGGEFSTGTTGIFQPELTFRKMSRFTQTDTVALCHPLRCNGSCQRSGNNVARGTTVPVSVAERSARNRAKSSENDNITPS